MGTSLEYIFSGLVFLTTWAGWREHQLEFPIGVTIQSLVIDAKPHQSKLLLSGQQVVAIRVCSWH